MPEVTLFYGDSKGFVGQNQNEIFLCLNPSAALVLCDRLCLILREIHEKWLVLVGPVRLAAERIAGELMLG